jgi:hypothetical protein
LLPHYRAVKQSVEQSQGFATMRATGRVRSQQIERFFVERLFNNLAPIY